MGDCIGKKSNHRTHQIREEMESYCLPEIARTVNKLGGIDDSFVPRAVESGLDRPYQMGLFDEG